MMDAAREDVGNTLARARRARGLFQSKHGHSRREGDKFDKEAALKVGLQQYCIPGLEARVQKRRVGDASRIVPLSYRTAPSSLLVVLVVAPHVPSEPLSLPKVGMVPLIRESDPQTAAARAKRSMQAKHSTAPTATVYLKPHRHMLDPRRPAAVAAVQLVPGRHDGFTEPRLARDRQVQLTTSAYTRSKAICVDGIHLNISSIVVNSLGGPDPRPCLHSNARSGIVSRAHIPRMLLVVLVCRSVPRLEDW
jgi:hypothetical protein